MSRSQRMQPVVYAETEASGTRVIRFQVNTFVRSMFRLLTPEQFNRLVALVRAEGTPATHSADDYAHAMQLIGVTVSHFVSDDHLVPQRWKDRAEKAVRALEGKSKKKGKKT